jgi:flagellar assembly factor FliW
MINQQNTIFREAPQSNDEIILNGMNIEQRKVIKFTYGLPGFEELTKFEVEDLKDYQPFSVLQSLEETDISMLILDVRYLKICDQIKISFDELKRIGVYSDNIGENIKIYVILKIDEEKQILSANVKAPIVINTEKRLGGQIILDDKNLPVEYILKDGLRLINEN